MPGFLFCLPLLLLCSPGAAQTNRPSASIVETSSLNKEITDFLDKEMTAHLNDITSYDPAPNKVFAAGTTGDIGDFCVSNRRHSAGTRGASPFAAPFDLRVESIAFGAKPECTLAPDDESRRGRSTGKNSNSPTVMAGLW